MKIYRSKSGESLTSCEDRGPHTTPPAGDNYTIGCPSLTNEKHSGERLLRHRGMEGLPTFRHRVQLLSSTDP
jgi:hypothetical protein